MPFQISNREAIERLLGECERRIENFERVEVERVAAAIAKLDKAPEVRCAHVAEAIQYDQSGGLDVCAWRLRGTPAGSRAWSVLATLAHIDDPRRDSSTDPRLA